MRCITELPSYPGYFREPHWLSMRLPEISSVTLIYIYIPWGMSQLSLLIAACFDVNCAVCGIDNIVKCYKCKHGYYLNPMTDRCERKWRLDGTILFTLEVLLYTLRCRLTFVFDNVVWAVKFYSKLLISCARNFAWVLRLQITMGGKVLEHLKAQLWLRSSPVYIRGWLKCFYDYLSLQWCHMSIMVAQMPGSLFGR